MALSQIAETRTLFNAYSARIPCPKCGRRLRVSGDSRLVFECPNPRRCRFRRVLTIESFAAKVARARRAGTEPVLA
jgi:NAD-dependent DNA ligase